MGWLIKKFPGRSRPFCRQSLRRHRRRRRQCLHRQLPPLFPIAINDYVFLNSYCSAWWLLVLVLFNPGTSMFMENVPMQHLTVAIIDGSLAVCMKVRRSRYFGIFCGGVEKNLLTWV